MLSAIANFAFIPYYPVWSLLLITLDIFVIWAVAAHGGAMIARALGFAIAVAEAELEDEEAAAD